MSVCEVNANNHTLESGLYVVGNCAIVAYIQLHPVVDLGIYDASLSVTVAYSTLHHCRLNRN